MAVALAIVMTVFASAGAQQAGPDYLSEIRDAADFELISIESQRGGEVERVTKFLVPARPDPGLLPLLFQNTRKYAFHFEFLRAVFPDRFPDLTIEEYFELVELRATRDYYAGTLYRFRTSQGTTYGFSVFTDEQDPRELLGVAETRAVHDALAAVFAPRPFAYAPDSLLARLAAREWRDPGFPIYFGSETGKTYEAYTEGIGYGRVRRLTLAAFQEASAAGLLSWQDILVLDRSPEDIEGVVAGVITGDEQEDLSHVAIRTARRGTPNAFLADPHTAFSSLEGKLVRLEVTRTSYKAAEASLVDAERWWIEHRPRLSEEPRIDPDHASLDSLEEMDLSGAVVSPEARYGGKATNFARLQKILTGPFEVYREKGFAIPVRWYLEFLRSNRTQSPIDPGREVTYEEYIGELMAWDRFQSDTAVRHAALAALRDEMVRRGVVPPALVASVARRVGEVFGSTRAIVRLRSSSNVEDALEFNGAGLYDSLSACAEDDLDTDRTGPSACDDSEDDERGIARALRAVWASLWNFRAHEERAWYGISHEKTAMAVLVSIAYGDEKANGVAFTGNPGNVFDDRYHVTAQVGEVSVVSPAPGVRSEKSVLEVEGGRVLRIERIRPSTLAPPGGIVLGDGNLRDLGGILDRIERDMPVELGAHDRSEVLFDIEFKVRPDGRIAVKQVRPFLAPEPLASGPDLILEIPPGTEACGVFLDGRTPREEYEAKARVRFVPGRHVLPTSRPSFPGSIIAELLHGPGAAPAPSAGPGRFRLELLASGTGEVTYRFRYQENFVIGGEELAMEIHRLDFVTRPGAEPELVKTLDEEHVAKRLVMVGGKAGGWSTLMRLASCTYPSIPRWSVHAELEGGVQVDLEERFDPPDAGSGPAMLAEARVRFGAEATTVSDYWRLVYAAQHHNVRVQYWVVFDPPAVVPGVQGAVRVLELAEPDVAVFTPAAARYLGTDFQALGRPAVSCWRKGPLGEPLLCGFHRGDADSTGVMDITDPIFLLRHLFQQAANPACEDSADINDDGILDVTDAVIMLTYLFRGVDLSAAPGPSVCGNDSTTDVLRECASNGCF